MSARISCSCSVSFPIRDPAPCSRPRARSDLSEAVRSHLQLAGLEATPKCKSRKERQRAWTWWLGVGVGLGQSRISVGLELGFTLIGHSFDVLLRSIPIFQEIKQKWMF